MQMSLLQERVLQSWEQSCSWKQNLTMKFLDNNGNNSNLVDLSDFIYSSTAYFKTKQKIYFGVMGPTDIPNNDPFEDKLETWNTLFRSLYEACNGTKIISYGDYKVKEYSDEEYPLRKIACYRHHCYHRGHENSVQCISTQDDLNHYRATTVHNDYRNDRQNGHKGKKRKSDTTKPISASDRCPFWFVIGYDKSKGYFLAAGKGYNTHHGHVYDGTWQSRPSVKAIDPKFLQNIKDLGVIHASSTISKTLCHNQSGSILSNSQIEYITRLKGKVTLDSEKSYEPKELIEDFRSKGICYVALLNGKKAESLTPSSYIENYDGDGDVVTNEPTSTKK